MGNKSLKDQETCRRGHDLRQPHALGIDSRGRTRCLVCKRARDLATAKGRMRERRSQLAGQGVRTCSQGHVLDGSTLVKSLSSSRLVCAVCREQRTRVEAPASPLESILTMKVLSLQEERERETVAWRREEIRLELVDCQRQLQRLMKDTRDRRVEAQEAHGRPSR